MKQRTVYELLNELGGRATSRQISELALKKYPEYSLHSYDSDRLRKFRNWGYVKKNADGTCEFVTKRGPPHLRQRRLPTMLGRAPVRYSRQVLGETTKTS